MMLDSLWPFSSSLVMVLRSSNAKGASDSQTLCPLQVKQRRFLLRRYTVFACVGCSEAKIVCGCKRHDKITKSIKIVLRIYVLLFVSKWRLAKTNTETLAILVA